MNRAVLVIDVQRGLCEGEYETFDAAGVIGRINEVTAKARTANALVVFIQHESKDGGLLVHGSRLWELAPQLDIAETDIFLRKTASDSFHHTELDAILKQHGVSELVICGMQSDFCVDNTTRRALALGYSVVLVSDGHTTLDNKHLTAAQITQHHNETLSNIDSYGVRVRLESARDVLFR